MFPEYITILLGFFYYYIGSKSAYKSPLSTTSQDKSEGRNILDKEYHEKFSNTYYLLFMFQSRMLFVYLFSYLPTRARTPKIQVPRVLLISFFKRKISRGLLLGKS